MTQNVIAQEETPKIEEEKLHTFEVSAQLRPRFEYRNGAYLPLSKGDEPAILVNNRTRLNFDMQVQVITRGSASFFTECEYLGASTTDDK